jgi:hypothetical protein
MQNVSPSLSLPEVLSRALRIYGENLATLVLPVAVVMLPLTVISLLISTWFVERYVVLMEMMNNASSEIDLTNIASNMTDALLNYGAVTVVVSLIQTVLVNGFVTYLASESYFGRRATLGETLRATLARLNNLIIGLMLIFAGLTTLTIVLSLIFFACGLGVPLLVYLALPLLAIYPAVSVLERTEIRLGLRRAWSLGRARFWQLFGLTAMLTIGARVFSLLLSMLLGTSQTVTAGDVLIQMGIDIVFAPLTPIAYTLVYYDARVRLEGLDEKLKSSEGARPSDLESPQPAEAIFSNKDVGSIFLLLVVLFVLGVGAYVCALTVLV